MHFILLITALSLVEYVGDSNLKFYSRNHQTKNLVIGIVAYIFVVKLLIEALKRRNLILTNGMWDAISTIIATFLAFFILHERLNNWQQWFGLASVIVGVVFLNWGKQAR